MIIYWFAGGGEDSTGIKGGRWEDNVKETWKVTWVGQILLSSSHICWSHCLHHFLAKISTHKLHGFYQHCTCYWANIETNFPSLEASFWFSGCERLLVKHGWWQKCGTERTCQDCWILQWCLKDWISWHVSKIDINLTFLKERKNTSQKFPPFPDVSILYLSLLPLTFAKKETTVTRCDITCHFTDIWKV